MEDIELMDHWCVSLMRASVGSWCGKTALRLCPVCNSLAAQLSTMCKHPEVAVGVHQLGVYDTWRQVNCKLDTASRCV